MSTYEWPGGGAPGGGAGTPSYAAAAGRGGVASAAPGGPTSLRPPRLRREATLVQGAGTAELLGRLLRDIPSLVSLLLRLVRDPRVSRLDKLLLATALTYLVLPHDVIPDWIPVLGQVDDLLLIAATLHRLLLRAGPDLLFEHWDGDPYTLELLMDGIERVRGRFGRRG